MTNLIHLLVRTEVNGPETFSATAIEAQMQVAWKLQGLRKLKCARAFPHFGYLSWRARLVASAAVGREVKTEPGLFLAREGLSAANGDRIASREIRRCGGHPLDSNRIPVAEVFRTQLKRDA
jgi:hypothetical protein